MPVDLTALTALLPDVSLSAYLAMCVAIAGAYVIFGMAGFGTALVAGPLLAYLMPVSQIVALLALMDCTAAAFALLRDGRAADRAELGRLLPCMLAGSLVGAALLLKLQSDLLPLLLGVFAMGYAIWSLAGKRPNGFTPRAALPFGLGGGMCSAMFGSGGFLYAIYLSGRLGKDAMRMTQSTLIGVSTLTRLVLFALAGVYAGAAIIKLALLLAPAMALGLWAGRRITLRLSREQFLRMVNAVVLCSGGALVLHYLLRLD
ncbi:sulfite exporter TauE/SafE family protein [Cupriavidus basilensis]|uniref:Probable membrane transporter protein n=1 Tax=Cupriavidus basilensis TaxID=68895 RepID=A0A643FPB0_9BURK|nr:sulfite exporter TauE/SafE family protein [Cupriavidus basilensis]QOT79961.1 sulfite exporter TauE/SafE family protein [Cupriavidus basilensis]